MAQADYEKLAALVAEQRAVLDQLETQLRQQIDQSRDMHDQLEAIAQVRQPAEQMRAAAEEMLLEGHGQDPGLAYSAVTRAEAAKAAAKRARKRWPGQAWDTAWDILKRMFPLLWGIIGHLVKVKEWTVSGQVGTGVLGLGSASISVTFG